jgi:hypothetical protein
LSLSLHAEYLAYSKARSIKENWLVQFYYGDESSFTGLSFKDADVSSNHYYGAILNKPSIRSSIDLSSSKAKTANVSFTVANFEFLGSKLSAELMSGSRSYINRTVKVFSQLGEDDNIAVANQIYEGRLISIDHDESRITLGLEEKRPWDFITFPQAKATQRNIYIPVVYGDYSGNTIGEEVRDMEKGLFPAPVLRLTDSSLLVVMPKSESNILPHYYESSLDAFVPLETSEYTSATQSSIKYDHSANVALISKTLERSFKTDPISVGATDEAVANTSDNILLYSHSGFVELLNQRVATDTAGSLDDKDITYSFPIITGEITALSVVVDADVFIATGNTTSGNYRSEVFFLYGGSGLELTGLRDNSAASNSTVDLGTVSVPILSQAYTDNDNQLKTPFGLKCLVDLAAGIQANIVTAHLINKFQIYMKVKNDFGEEERSSTEKELEKIKHLYFGHDGNTNDFSGGSGTADCGLEIHRSLLARFTNVDETPYNYSSNLNVAGARISTAWKGRLWALEPIDLDKTLERLQYEFGFIYKFRADGTGSYWYVKDSYASGDVSATLTGNDIKNINVSNTPFSELQTKMVINYQKHPAKSSEYGVTQTSTNAESTGARAVYNIESRENISNINLEYNYDKPGNTDLSSGDPNDGFADYYYNIFGDIRKIVTCEVVNPSLGYLLETGDVVKFDSMPFDPFGSNWNGYYMITSLNRSPGKVAITCREVG